MNMGDICVKNMQKTGPPIFAVENYNPIIDEVKKKEELKRYGFNLNDYVIKDEKPMYKMKMFKWVRTIKSVAGY